MARQRIEEKRQNGLKITPRTRISASDAAQGGERGVAFQRH